MIRDNWQLALAGLFTIIMAPLFPAAIILIGSILIIVTLFDGDM